MRAMFLLLFVFLMSALLGLAQTEKISASAAQVTTVGIKFLNPACLTHKPQDTVGKSICVQAIERLKLQPVFYIPDKSGVPGQKTSALVMQIITNEDDVVVMGAWLLEGTKLNEPQIVTTLHFAQVTARQRNKPKGEEILSFPEQAGEMIFEATDQFIRSAKVITSLRPTAH